MTLQEVKREFFTFRNGVLADALRKQCGLTQKMIFGLNLPQLKEIAARIGRDEELSAQLWADEECRESRLLAILIGEPQGSVKTVEEADVLCHAVLRHRPDAAAIAAELLRSDDPLTHYQGLRLQKNLEMM